MKKLFASLAITLLAVSAIPQEANAFKWHHFHHHHHHGAGSNGMSGGEAYVFGATFCAAGALWLRALYVSQNENRELTRREAWETAGFCFLPVVGPIITNAVLDANPAWERAP
ncbi:MAG: hypothetical protein EPO23_04790 [Xanthobacteraceae bacterium]|nr:MAG: hypothetical protein EPO23_04790 [Xanthobacteraceae bacterium]